MIYVSLCLPTNGVSEWVFPVLESIYEQEADPALWEVIVTDNGENEAFAARMKEYSLTHANLIYRKTDAYLFENQIESLRLASGQYLKFVNHRFKLLPGSIQWMIKVVRDTIEQKPVIYWSNGVLRLKERFETDFNGFVSGLKQYASWTLGVGVWKEDFEKIPVDKEYNRISPHSDVLFAEKHKELYIIDDTPWAVEMDGDHSKKGKYDLFKTFGCDELTITLEMYVAEDITAQTFKAVKHAYLDALAEFYCLFCILNEPCSYDLTGFRDAMGIFFNGTAVKVRAWCKLPRLIARRLKAKVKKS